MEDFFCYMNGPKGENMELFRRFILEVTDDQMFWRRNFCSEDKSVISAFDQSKQGYREFTDRLRDRLFEFLSDAKKGVPFSSPRYIGHMNTDLLLPGLIGYFAAMLYNQNNVAGESSPVTVRLESEVIKMLLQMVGMKPDQGWGYLCSGGTTANVFSLWVARNLRTLPISIRLALQHNISDISIERVAEALRQHKIRLTSLNEVDHKLKQAQQFLTNNLKLRTAKGQEKLLVEMSVWELLNIPVAELADLPSTVSIVIQEKLACSETEADLLANELVQTFALQKLGGWRFRVEAANLFPETAILFHQPWLIYTSKNGHYSWEKGADIAGLGYDSLIKVPHTPGFDMDLDVLEELLLEAAGKTNPTSWTLMLVSDFGTTEEGALDNLPGVHKLLQALQQEYGMTLWWHVDACYGGYLASMVRRNQTETTATTPAKLKEWLVECGQATGLSAEQTAMLVEMSEQGQGAWLPWKEFIDRTAAMAEADSVTIDPHKLGYIPYPAGALLLRYGSTRTVVSRDVPYLWQQESYFEETPELFTGKFTLEGSRPGAAAAACWLAHTTVPLDQTGHGKLLALSILATRQLYQTLQERFIQPGQREGIALLHQPHSNMICYVPYDAESVTLDRLECLTNLVLDKLSPTKPDRKFMAVSTRLDLSTRSPSLEGFDVNSPFHKLLKSLEQDLVSIKVIRSVVMGPLSLNAQTRPTRDRTVPIFEAYADYLLNCIKEAIQHVDVNEAMIKAAQWKRDMNFIVMDDDPSVSEQLRELLVELNHPRIRNSWQHYQTQEEAIANIQDYNTPLDMVFLDIDMRGATDSPKGDVDGGYEAYRQILIRNQEVGVSKFRVQCVVFFSKGYGNHEDRLNDLHQQYPVVHPRLLEISKMAFGNWGNREEAYRTARQIIREVASIEIS